MNGLENVIQASTPVKEFSNLVYPCTILDHLPWVGVSYLSIPRGLRVGFHILRLIAIPRTTLHHYGFLHVNHPFPSRKFSHLS